jgi:TonB family protein
VKSAISRCLVPLLFVASAAGQTPTIYSPGNGVTAPVPVKRSVAQYTMKAMKAGVEGCAEVEAVVLADGTVGEVKLTRSLDSKYGMDEGVIDAVKKWVFEPGMKDGRPVNVRCTIQQCFTQGKSKKPKK